MFAVERYLFIFYVFESKKYTVLITNHSQLFNIEIAQVDLKYHFAGSFFGANY